MIDASVQVGVWNFLDREMVQLLHVALVFVGLKRRNLSISVVNSQESYQSLKILDFFLGNIDVSLENKLAILNFRFGLEHRFHGCLSFRQLLQFDLICSLFLLTGNHRFLNVTPADNAVEHTFGIEMLSLKPDICFIIWIPLLQEILAYLVLDLPIIWVCNHSLVVILLTVVLKTHIFKFG